MTAIYNGHVVALTHQQIARNITTELQSMIGRDEALELISQRVDLNGTWVEIEAGLRGVLLDTINSERHVGIAALAGLVEGGDNSSLSNNSTGS